MRSQPGRVAADALDGRDPEAACQADAVGWADARAAKAASAAIRTRSDPWIL
jgi:hypothetical protein